MIKALTRRLESSRVLSTLFRRVYVAYYTPIINRERHLANITSVDRVLFIGAGACPVSAMLIAKKTCASVTAIDIDSAAINKARSAAETHGLTAIQFALGAGEACDASDYDVVVLANQLLHKQAVIDRVRKTARPGTRIIVRMGRRQHAYLPSDRQMTHPYRGVRTSALLVIA